MDWNALWWAEDKIGIRRRDVGNSSFDQSVWFPITMTEYNAKNAEIFVKIMKTQGSNYRVSHKQLVDKLVDSHCVVLVDI